MKFGGTSVGDAVRIRNVAAIIAGSSRRSEVVVIVSAMCDVTNKLLEAATEAESGNWDRASAIFQQLLARHLSVVEDLLNPGVERSAVSLFIRNSFRETESICRDAASSRHLSAADLDFVASLGERVCAPMVAAAVSEFALPSEAVAATQLIVTDGNYGRAEPLPEATRDRCESRLRSMLRRGVVPVVTGFLGATIDGVLTTLGRGGSDYSATIVGAAMNADEVVIWTDVDGVLTADPKIVPQTSTIPEISYVEASNLASFGAKVLHPKTLRPVMESDIPVWIRNSFSPERYGTRITPMGVARNGKVMAVTAISDARLITISPLPALPVTNLLSRVEATFAAVCTEPLLFMHSLSQADVCLAIGPSIAHKLSEALLEEFSDELSRGAIERVALHSDVAVVTLVGQCLHLDPAISERATAALHRDDMDIIATGTGTSGCSLSVAVAQESAKAALLTLHNEFHLHSSHS